MMKKAKNLTHFFFSAWKHKGDNQEAEAHSLTDRLGLIFIIMSVSLSFGPFYWGSWFLIGCIGTIICGCILKSEYEKRTSGVTFTSQYLRIFSSITIWNGFISAILAILRLLPGFCLMDYSAIALLSGSQFVSMGFYQLSRLHYCFSNVQVHHNRGYPLWIFVLMIFIGSLSLISWIMLNTMAIALPSKCGYHRDFNIFWEYRESTVLFEGNVYDNEHYQRTYYLWFIIHSVLGLLWDLTTLMLYCYKIWKISKIYRTQRDAVWKNVLLILHRIVILTVFYQICLFLVVCVTAGLYSIPSSSSTNDAGIHSMQQVLTFLTLQVALSLSMYLMQEHNTKEYHQFLRLLRRCYLNYLCYCCCHQMVDRQLDEFALYESCHLELDKEDKPRKQTYETEFDNLSVGVTYSINRMGMKSLPTETMHNIEMIIEEEEEKV